MSIGRTHKEIEAPQAPDAERARLRPAGDGRIAKLGLLARAAVVTTREARRDGLARTARRAVRTARLYGLGNAMRRAEGAGGHWTWYRLELRRNERRALPSGMELRRCLGDDVPLLAQLDSIASLDATRRMNAGGVLWIVLDQGRAMFACWIFTDRSPVGQAQHGWLRLPTDTAHLKDIITAEAARGRGLAPAAISMIADSLAVEGFVTLFGRVEDSNFSSRRVYEKLGFETLPEDDPVAVDFARQLGS